MSYSYRGVAYEVPANTLAISTTTVRGKYRGAEFAITRVTDVPRQPLTRLFSYRGVRYGATQVITPVSLTPALI